MITTLIKNRRFGRLVATGRKKSYPKFTKWECICDCGSVKYYRGDKLYDGGARACGCGRKFDYINRDRIEPTIVPHIRHISKILKPRSIPNDFFSTKLTHGMTNTDEFKVWCSMKERCYNPKTSNYHRYGGRGIEVCDEWRDDFKAFYDFMGDRPSPVHSIERYDNDGDYSPDNCEWATAKEQANNTSRNKLFSFNGIELNPMQWSEKMGIPYSVLSQRLNHLGWSFAKAISTPVRHRHE